MTDTTPGDLPLLVMPSPHASVSERLREVATRLPHRPALVSRDGELSYAELQRRVDVLAGELLPVLAGDPSTAGASGRQPVGIFAEQGVDSVAAMFAVLATGHPYVVLDVLLPPARVALIVERAGAAVLLTDDQRREEAAELPGVRTVRGLVPVGDPAAAAAGALPAVALDDPAGLIFTSGTTGLPKGVVWTQRTLLGCGQTTREILHSTPQDRISLVVPFGYAVGQELIFGALLNGATLCVRDPRIHGIHDLADFVESAAVTTLNCTPSLLRALHAALPADHVLSSVRLVTTAGDKVYGSDVTDFRRHLSGQAGVMNWMGSSETESLTTFELRAGDPVPDGIVPIGTAVPLRELSILGPDDEPVPAGEVGVLHATSAYFSSGYWRDPAATAARFRVEADGRTRYCTGDRARMTADGIVQILGRGDDSVKIRGYLVEPAEVESALRTLPAVLDAVVRGTRTDEGTRLVAWVVPGPGQPVPSAEGLRGQLGVLLPDWMVPRDVVLLAELPRNERGKVDVGALPAPQERPEIAPPVTDAERVVERVWAAVLGLEHVGRDESFTALGGESLGVEEMLAALEQAFDVTLATDDLAAHPTLAEFAAFLDARQEQTRDDGGATAGRRGASGRLAGGLLRRLRGSGRR